MFPIPAELNDVLLKVLTPVLKRYFFSFVQIYCGDLQENVTDSKPYELSKIVSDLREVIGNLRFKQNNSDASNIVSQNDSTLQSHRKDEHPPIWGPGFVEPPGGPEYRNRYPI